MIADDADLYSFLVAKGAGNGGVRSHERTDPIPFFDFSFVLFTSP